MQEKFGIANARMDIINNHINDRKNSESTVTTYDRLNNNNNKTKMPTMHLTDILHNKTNRRMIR